MMQNVSGTSLNNKMFRGPKAFWISIIIFIVLIVGAFIVIAHYSHNSSNFPKADQGHGTTFQGMSSFISSGLTTAQVNELIEAFSKFSPKAKNISINPDSLVTAPHDPNKDVGFTINFVATVDSTPYKAAVNYTGLDTVRLILSSDKTGAQIFDSGVIRS